jgi:hypothetical protein
MMEFTGMVTNLTGQAPDITASSDHINRLVGVLRGIAIDIGGLLKEYRF